MNWHHLSTGQVGYPQPEGGYLEQTYDFSVGCPVCQIGKQQKAPFRFRDEPKAKHSQFIGLNWVFDEIFVREEVKSIFEEEKVTGISFERPVKHKTGQPLESIYQLIVTTVLPEAIDTRDLVVERCELPTDPVVLRCLTAAGSRLVKGPFCGSRKYNYPQETPFRVSRRALDSQPSIVRLSEWFGSGGSAGRPILISDRVKQIIDRAGWRGAFMTPISFS